MSRIYLLLLLATCQYMVFGQNIAVKLFRVLENDMSARIDYYKMDQNGEKAALIKIVTTQTGFDFEGGSLGIVATEQKTAEIWVYVPRGAKAITIKHPKLGVLRNYAYPVAIVAATVYELELVSGTVETIVKPTEIETQWLAINSKPEGASVFIEEQLMGITPFSRKYPVGDYNYRLELPRYNPQAGKVTLAGEKKVLDITLKPHFGSLRVTSTPESGMLIYLDDENTGKTTPATIDGIASGEHTLKLMNQWFQPLSKKVTVSDELTTTADFAMTPAFADITVTTSPAADILVDGKKVGNGTYTSRMLAGIYTIKAEKEKHNPDQKQITVVAGGKQTIALTLKPMTGTLDVASTPFDAAITLNDKEYGTTPNTIKNLLIGTYTLILKKAGYGTLTKTIIINENATTEVNETLPTGLEVTITSNPSEVQLSIDGVFTGLTPYKGTLSFGNHNIKLVNGKKEVTETITITQNSQTNWSFDVNEVLTVKDIDNNVYKTVTIGTQTWMVENLKTTRYRDGTPIPNVTNGSDWNNTYTPAYCWYDNNISNKGTYGALYNWYAVNTGKLAPTGWHVPSDTEWQTLIDYLGGDAVAGGKMKETGTAHWDIPNNGATNSSGFSALPGGKLSLIGKFYSDTDSGYWWSSTEQDTYRAWERVLLYGDSNVYRHDNPKQGGYSVRCVRD